MNRKLIYSLLTLTSLLAVYQLYFHVLGSKLKLTTEVTTQVAEQLTEQHTEPVSQSKDVNVLQRKDVDYKQVQYKVQNGGDLSGNSEEIKDAAGKRRIHQSENTQLGLLFDKAPSSIDTPVEEIKHSETTKEQLPSKFITIQSKGRLGNQMFEYASLLGIAHKNNLRAFITGKSMLVDSFNVKTPFYSNLRFQSSFIEYAEKKGCVFEPEVMHLGSTSDILLKGYFQSWKYFDSYEKELREQLRWSKTITEKSRHEFASLIPLEKRTYVGVHVRRGDMEFKVGYREFGYVTADLAYILRAMEYFRTKMKDVFFIVASDDYRWCKDNINGDDVTFTNQTIPEIDMAILTLCNHTIITVGSFGWWAAWLAGGEAVYFKNFPQPGSKLDALFKADDYWPPFWIPM